MISINSLLVRAGQVKLNGYKQIEPSFMLDLIDYIYEGYSSKLSDSLKSKITKSVDKTGKVTFAKLNDKGSFRGGISLASSTSNRDLKMIYVTSKMNPSYRELGFLMFATGIVNARDYLKNETDIGWIVSKLNIDGKSNGVSITDGIYTSIIGMCIENMSRGIDYGVNIYDFIYHVLQHKNYGSKHMKSTTYLMNFLSKLTIEDYSCFDINGVDLDKYINEVGVCLPLMCKYMDTGKVTEILTHMVTCGNIVLAQHVLSSEYLLESRKSGFMYNLK